MATVLSNSRRKFCFSPATCIDGKWTNLILRKDATRIEFRQAWIPSKTGPIRSKRIHYASPIHWRNAVFLFGTFLLSGTSNNIKRSPEIGMDTVSCPSCALILDSWDPLDDPWNIHAAMSPLCSFVIHRQSMIFEEEQQNRICGRKVLFEISPRPESK